MTAPAQDPLRELAEAAVEAVDPEPSVDPNGEPIWRRDRLEAAVDRWREVKRG